MVQPTISFANEAKKSMFTKKTLVLLLASATLIFCFAGCSQKESEATSAAPQKAETPTSSSAASRPPRNPLKNAYFGDLHLHSGYSMDAFAFGTRTTPEDSYRYAMGETRGLFRQTAKAHCAAGFPCRNRPRRVSGRGARHDRSQWPIRQLGLVQDDDQHRPQGHRRGIQEAPRFHRHQQAAAGV